MASRSFSMASHGRATGKEADPSPFSMHGRPQTVPASATVAALPADS